MDIANLNFKEVGTQTLQLVHPTTEATLIDEDGAPMTITLYGRDSNQFRKLAREYGNRKLKKRSSNQTMEEIEEVSINILAGITTGWNIVFEGKHLEFSLDAARWLYSEYPWIREQVDEFVNERTNFLLEA